MYDEGRGVPADGALSAAWYRKAAEQGDVKGQYYLAQCYEYGVGVALDLKAASAWYAKAAKQGHRESAAALARLKAAG
jgi:TPR repeat protein